MYGTMTYHLLIFQDGQSISKRDISEKITSFPGHSHLQYLIACSRQIHTEMPGNKASEKLETDKHNSEG